MSLPPAPIRFLLLVIGGWIGLRLVMLAPAWVAEPRLVPPAPARTAPLAAHFLPTASIAPLPTQLLQSSAGVTVDARFPRAGSPFRTWATRSGFEASAFSEVASRLARAPPVIAAPATIHVAAAPPALAAPGLPGTLATRPRQLAPAPPFALSPTPFPAPLRPAATSRWSGSAWLFVRDDGAGRGLAPGGTLGGSQAGARIAYRLNRDPQRPLAVSARLYAPLDRTEGAEAALGLDWRPLAKLPVHILAERRQRLGREGRSDFSLTIYGGGEKRLLDGKLRVEAYAQAGIVGIEERDLFADGAVRAGVPVGPLEVGAGAWAGAQPGASRVDIGPQATARLPLGGTTLRASAEWRFRIAGDAAPGSGPTLTLSTDF